MAIINTGLLEKGLRSEFFQRFRSAEAVSFYQRLSMRAASTSDKESYKWLGSVPQVREWGDGRVAKGIRTEGYNVANRKWEATLEVDRDELSDDQTGQIRIRVAELAERAASHKDKLVGSLIVAGSDAASLAYDGLPFFDTAHMSGASGSQSNELEYLAADADATNFTVAEAKAALEQAIAQMQKFVDDRGEAMDVTPSGLLVICPPHQGLRWREVLRAAQIGGTTNVTLNVADLVVTARLTADDDFFVFKTDAAVKPFVFQDREPIEFRALAENSEEEFKREKYLYGVRARYNFAYGYWQYAIRTTFTTS